MEKTITITHHVAKPEYHWEIVVPEGPTVLLTDGNLQRALGILGLPTDDGIRAELTALPNGGSRSFEADVEHGAERHLTELSV